MSTQE